MQFGLLAEKLVGAQSRYAFIVYVSESYRTFYTTVPLMQQTAACSTRAVFGKVKAASNNICRPRRRFLRVRA